MAYWEEYHKEVDQIELWQVGISISSKGCFEIEEWFSWSFLNWSNYFLKKYGTEVVSLPYTLIFLNPLNNDCMHKKASVEHPVDEGSILFISQ